MNKEKVIEFASNVFSNLIPISDDLYKGELTIGNKKAGIYYIDLNQQIPLDNFSEYQDKILSKEYYTHPGSLQWNYYLFLLQDNIDPEKKSKIEMNDKYARKYIFNEDEFKDFLQLEHSTQDLNSNIITEWKQALDKADLQEVYSKEGYTDLISRFENNITKKFKTETLTNSSQLTTVNYIKRLWLKPNYRKYPIEHRDFEFKNVNLITGINGVGKTCLFEAIETIICGRTFRNPDDKADDGCIEAIFNNSKSIEKCAPSNNEKYRKLDSFWYANNYSRDNFLYNSFNKFNLFNADAAHRFSTSNSDQEVKTALLNIVLGPEYDYISDRIMKVYERIRPLYNRTDAALNEAYKKLNEAEGKISRFKTNDSIDFITKNILKSISDLNFKNQNSENNKSFIEIEKNNNEIKSLIKVLKEMGEFNSLAEIEERIEINKQKIKKLNEVEDKIKSVSEQITKVDSNIKTAQTKQNILEQSLKYFNNEQLLLITDLNNKIKENHNEITKRNIVEKNLENFDLKQFSSDETIDTIFNKINSDSLIIRTDIQRIEADISAYLNKFSEVEKLIKQIKIIGKNYVELNSEGTNCPLCQASYTKEELYNRVQQLNEISNKDDSNFLQLNETLQNLKEQRSQLIEYSSWITAVSASLKVLGEYSNKSLNDIVLLLLEFLSNSHTYIKTGEDLKALQDLALSYNVSEKELNEIKIKLPVIFENPLELEFKNRKVFEDLLESVKKDLFNQQDNKKRLSEDLLKLQTEINFNSALEVSGFDLSKRKNLAIQQQRALNNAVEYFQKIKDIVEIDESSNLNDILLISSMLSSNLDTLKTEKQNQFELDQGKTQRDEANRHISSYTEPHKRYKLAYETLLSLSSNKGNEQLELFFNQNLKEIVDIFKTIHAPREFENIIMQNGALILINQNKQSRKITQISTGQRSALALSIFITLNRKLKNGPNIIMFDDPVSFIDDLNALSFLDFLRFFLLKENKQIFFATANARLASLFEKKFEFLGEDFKKWELRRA